MKILDENNNVLDESTIDYEAGHIVLDSITIEHPAVEAVAEQGHYEIVAEYPNSGKDVEWVVDVPGVKGCEAWTETKEIKRYVLYTKEELATQFDEQQHVALTTALRGTDLVVLEALEGLLTVTTPTDLVAALVAINEQLKDVLESRLFLRKQIAVLTKKKEG